MRAERLAAWVTTSAHRVVGVAGRLVAQGDDLEPVEQNPDDIRDQACQLLDVPCEPPKAPEFKPPSDPPNLDLSFLKVFIFLLVVGLVAFLVWLVARYIASMAPPVDVEEAEEISVFSERIIDHSRTPADWRGEAEEHLAAGRYREALRCRYRALVGDLARRGLLDEIPGRTTGEERTQLAELAPESSPSFDRATAMFDRVWYGAAPVSRADHDRFVTEEGTVLAAAPRRGQRVSA
jgi:Domain of unknown function (DUF4129)